MELITSSQFAQIEKRMEDAGFSVETVKREISFAVQAINKSEQLRKCDPKSLLQSVMNIANIGLSLNPASKEAYLIPRYIKGIGMEAVLEPSYVGLIKLLTDTGSITSLNCQIVYGNDSFAIDLGRNEISHIPPFGKSRGDMVGVYACARLFDGNNQIEWMEVSQINEIRDRSETYKAFKDGKIRSCTWETDYFEMARKTVVKRIYKYLPRTDRMEKADEAIKLDNQDYQATLRQLNMIDSLLQTSTLDQDQRDSIELETTVMNAERAAEVITMLQLNQQPSDKELFRKLKA